MAQRNQESTDLSGEKKKKKKNLFYRTSMHYVTKAAVVAFSVLKFVH